MPSALDTQPLTPEQIALVNPRIRLQPREQLALRAAFEASLPAHAEVYLYGSRVDRSAAGGDIDLLIHVPGIAIAEELVLESRLRAEIESRLGERRVDLLFAPTLGEDAKPFVRLAAHGAVRLFP
jgi:predicted nucleotidyltransferase